MQPPPMVRGDIDGFFGLFIDNLLQLMLIAVLCPAVCGLPQDLVVGRILPGAAISIIVGNLFYGWQARQLMRRTGRTDITALPYGINTVSLMAYIFLVMAPVYRQTQDATLTWRVGLLACVGSAIIEVTGAFVGDWFRRHTPRAALLSALAGVAITFIAMGFVFQIFASPALALLPMMLILVSYSGRLKLPLGLPGGMAAVAIGVAIAWLSRLLGADWFRPAGGDYTFAIHWPLPVLHDATALLTSTSSWKQYLAIIAPMGLFNVIGSLQNLESAEAAGDRYPTRSSLLANGVGSMLAALFGSPFPTTIYIGHPGWKAMGARSAYSTLNGIAIALLCLVGGVGLVLRVVPLETTLGILLWIGIIITAQAFAEVPKSHALAVAVGLVPALASWALYLVESSLQAAGTSLFSVAARFTDLHIRGVIALSQGFLITSMILASILAFAIERKLLLAAAWAAAAAGLSMLGLIHAYELTPEGVRNRFGLAAAPQFAAAYAAVAIALIVLHYLHQRQPAEPSTETPAAPRENATMGLH